MAGTAIVAIPREDDYVWRLSSEKIPHLTLLFLGDQSSSPKLPKIIDFVEHVATNTLVPFGMSVDSRGELGPKKADVLFFKHDRWGYDKIKDARNAMLQNEPIAAAFASVEQFDGWIPHLTLGFPETPAKKDTREFPGIQWVSFDRLAVWTGDFEGPTFQLKEQEFDDLAMSEVVDSVLSHHGIKGMKWGVRKDKNGVRRGKPTAHPDAVLAKNSKAKVKKGSTDALSNLELQNLVTRMNLEKQFKTLQPPTASSRTKKIVGEILLNVGKQQASKVVNDQASKQVARLLANAAKG